MDHFAYRNNIYHAEDVSIPQLTAQIGTPFYCYSTATFAHHYTVFANQFTGMDIKICFAVKANSNVAVLKTLASLGSGADVVSEGEIRLALAAGIPPQNIVFSGVGKTPDEMAFALKQNIFQFNVESEAELLLLNEVAMSLKQKAPIAIRVNPDVDPKTHAKISTGQKESKFGVAMADAMEVYKKAATLTNIHVQSVSVHIGSQLTSLEPFRQAFARVHVFVKELREMGIAINTVDLGGGLGIPYGKETPPSPIDYAAVVKEEMRGLDCRLVFEPGRMIAGNAGILITKVLYVKESAHKKIVIVDAAMNDLMRPSLYDAHHEIIPVTIDTSAPTETVDIVGPVCETGDIFAENRSMPLPKAGDLLCIRSCGAYGAVMAGTYNARPLIAEVMVHGDQSAIIRARQTYAELIGRDSIPSWLA